MKAKDMVPINNNDKATAMQTRNVGPRGMIPALVVSVGFVWGGATADLRILLDVGTPEGANRSGR